MWANFGEPPNEDEVDRAANGETKIFHTFPLIEFTDMSEEMLTEAVEVITTALEKFPTNFDEAAYLIKLSMDFKFGASWHVVVGENFGFDVPYETNHMLFLYFCGNLGVGLWKCDKHSSFS